MTGVTVFCVKVGSKEPGPVMCEAFEALNDMGEDLRCEWLPEEQCLVLDKREKHSVYVFEEFGSAAFEHVVSTNNKAYGPMCILTCMKKSEPLPTAHPMYCLAMKGLVISCTTVPKDQRDSVHKHIEWMGGEVSRDFHDRVSHLVAGEVCSKKYRVAADLSKPIMSVEWVEGVLRASKTKLIHAADPQYLQQYRCLVFMGLVVSVSGLSGQDRFQIKELVESEGGKYSGELKVNECTHLVVNQPQGNKYEFAKKWQLKIVRPQWVMESVEAGYCLEEHKYKVEDGGKGEGRQAVTSTPNRRSNQSAAGISQLGDVSAITINAVEDTTMNFTLNQSLQTTTTSQLTTKQPQQASTDILGGFHIAGWKGPMFLDGCKIFLSGFTTLQLDKLKKMLNVAGAIRFNDITENITHVVIGQKIEEHLKKLQSLSSRPHIVSINWLVDGFNAKKCVPEELYYTLEPPESEQPSAPELSKLKKSEAKKDAERKSRTPTAAPAVAMDTTGMEDILSQYLPQGSSSTMGESTLVRLADQAEEGVAAAAGAGVGNSGSAKRQQGKTSGEQQEPPNYEDAETQDPNDVTELQGDEESYPFRGKSFITFGFDEGQTADLHKYIVECGGEIVPINTRRIPDYGVVPIMGFRVERTVGEVVTNAWLQISVEMDALQPIEANDIYTPLNPRDEMARPLEGVVLSISGYVGAERDVIAHIAEILGAICQDFFVRKANQKKGLLGNTHLVVNAPEGSKYEAARKWTIPAVDKAWVIGCAKQSQRLLESDFLVGQQAEVAASPKVPPKPPTPSQEKMPPPRLPPSNTRRVSSPPPVNNLQSNGQSSNTGRHISGSTDKGSSSSKMKRKASRGSKENTSSSNSENEAEAGEIPVKREKREDGEEGGAMETEDHVTGRSDENEEKDGDVLVEAGPQEVEKDEDDGGMGSGAAQALAGMAGTPTGNHRMSTSSSVAGSSRGERKPIDDSPPQPAAGAAVETPTGKGAKMVVEEMTTPASVVNTRVQKLIQENRRSGKAPTSKRGSEDDLSGLDTPSKFLREGVVYKPKYDLEAAYAAVDNMQTPGRRPGEKRDSVSLEELLSQSLAIAIKNASVKQQQQQQQQSVRPASSACQSPGVFRQSTPKPLAGVVIAVAKKLITRQSDYNSIASSLGADYRWTYDKSCTHFIFEGKQNDINKEFRRAKEHKKTIVSPHWLLMCQEQNCHVDESLFPHTYNPNMSLSLSCTPARSTRTTRTRSRLTKNQPTIEDTTTITTQTTRTRNQSSSNKTLTAGGSSKSSSSSAEKNPRATTRHSLRHRKSEAEEKKRESDPDTSKENVEQEGEDPDENDGGRDKTQSDEEMSRICSEVELEENHSKSDGLVNDLKNLMAASTKSYGAKQRRKNRRSETSFDQVLQEENNGSVSGAKKSRSNSRNVSRVEDEENKSRNNSRCSSRNSNLMPETQASQMMEVIWDDPKAREQQQKLAGDLAKYNQSVSPTADIHTAGRNQGRTSSALDQVDMDLLNPQRLSTEEQVVEARIPTPEAPSLAFPLVNTSRPSSPPRPVDVLSSSEEEEHKEVGEAEKEGKNESSTAAPPVFLMSGMPVQERDDYGALIEELGGEVLDGQNYDIRATHLAIEKPTRNEKFLASVAAGKWVVHKSYFEACRKERHFVKPDCYEWGTNYTASLCSGSSQHRLATAAHRWRLRLEEAAQGETSRGAFDGWRVLLLTKKEDSFTRLLEAGGARVMAPRPPFNRLEEVTHAFLDLGKVKCDLDVDALVRAGVECCKPEFIGSYLIDDPLPEPKDYYVHSNIEARKRKPSASEAPGTPDNKRRK